MPSSLTDRQDAPCVLALDTCLHSCQAAVLHGETQLSAASEPMSRGHQERLGVMTREVMAAAGLNFQDLTLVAVTVGPGSFTGLRVGLAFAKGLALALDIPCVGVGVLEALAASRAGDGGRAAVIDAGRARVYLQIFPKDKDAGTPELLDIPEAQGRLRDTFPSGRFTLMGPGNRLLADAWPSARPEPLAAPDPAVIGRLALLDPKMAATPIYLRPPDAVPKSGPRVS